MLLDNNGGLHRSLGGLPDIYVVPCYYLLGALLSLAIRVCEVSNRGFESNECYEGVSLEL